MGIALGLGIILGVRCVAGGVLALAFVPLASLLLLAGMSRPGLRQILLVGAAGVALGAAAGWRTVDEAPPPLVGDPPRAVVGVVVSDPELEPRGLSATVRWTDEDGHERTSLVFAQSDAEIERGGRVRLTGDVGGTHGNWIEARAVRVLDRPSPPSELRNAARGALGEAVASNVPGSPGSLALGLLIGDDSGLTDAEARELRRAGLSHITAVSGWNVTLVIGAFGTAFLALGLRSWRATLLQALAGAGYIWLVGPDPPVIRAGIMAATALLAVRLGRPAHSVTALILAAAVMVAVTPEALTSLSFRLSVLATIALVVTLHVLPAWKGWRAVVLTPAVTSAAIGLATAPLLAATFGSLTIWLVPSNVVVAPLVPVATLLGALILPLDAVGLGVVAGVPDWVVCGVVLRVARLCGSAAFGYWEFGPVSDGTMAALYAALVVALAALLPEGRRAGRELSRWTQREPAAAVVALAATCGTMAAAWLSTSMPD